MSGEYLFSEGALLQCRDTNTRVTSILSSIEKKEDVKDFITTVQLVQITINSLLKTKQQFKSTVLSDLHKMLREYESHLTRLTGTGGLMRILKSSRLRRRLEQINSKVHLKLQEFNSSLSTSADGTGKAFQLAALQRTRSHTGSSLPQSPQQNNRQSLSSSTSSAHQSPSPSHQQNLHDQRHDVETTAQLSHLIDDQDAKAVWTDLFGLNCFMVTWSKFIGGLEKLLTQITPDEEVVLRYILDYANTDSVSQHKFGEFMKGFGPVKDCVKNVKSIISARWFHGYLTRYETDVLLRGHPPGTFMIRFSSSAPGSFALGFTTLKNPPTPQQQQQLQLQQERLKNKAVDGTEPVDLSYYWPPNDMVTAHILIDAKMPVGFSVQEQNASDTRTFGSLHEIVDHYSSILQVPFAPTFPFEPWFEGDFSGAETSEVLYGQPPGSFLLRFSSQLGNYAISFVSPDTAISHSLVERETPDLMNSGGYRIWSEGRPLMFSSLKDVVQFYGEALRHPYKANNNPSAVRASTTILAWKMQRNTAMNEISSLVDSLFALNLSTPQHPTIQNGTPSPATNFSSEKVGYLLPRLFEDVLQA